MKNKIEKDHISTRVKITKFKGIWKIFIYRILPFGKPNRHIPQYFCYSSLQLDSFGHYLSLLLMKNSDQLDAIANPRLAERLNGWAAMMGFWALVGAYLATGQILPGIV